MDRGCNATLNINNSRDFGYDIWQTCDCEKWNSAKWKEALESIGDALQGLYNELECNPYQYALGDAINILWAINVNVERR